MTFACPHCNRKIKLAEAELTGVMTEMVEVAVRIGAHWNLVSEYVDCFRPDHEGHVNLKRRVRILKEVATLIESKEFQLDKKKYRTDINGIRWAMRIVCDLQKHGFPNHNYLKKVMINKGVAERLSAEGLTAEEEKERYTAPRWKQRDLRQGTRRKVKEDKDMMTLGEFLAKTVRGEK